MTGKEEDDDGKPKSTSESMRINQLADGLAHVEPEWLTDHSGFQLKQVGSGVLKGFLLSYKSSYVLSSFRPNLVVLVILCTNSIDGYVCEVE